MKFLWVVALLWLPLASAAEGQTSTGSLAGTIRDVSGGVIPGAVVTVKNAATGIARSATTDAEGRYRIPNLEPGDYEVRATLTGFRTAVRSGVVVTVGGATDADVEMIGRCRSPKK